MLVFGISLCAILKLLSKSGAGRAVCAACTVLLSFRCILVQQQELFVGKLVGIWLIAVTLNITRAELRWFGVEEAMTTLGFILLSKCTVMNPLSFTNA